MRSVRVLPKVPVSRNRNKGILFLIHDARHFPISCCAIKSAVMTEICNLVKTMSMYITFGSSKGTGFLQSSSSSSSFRLIGREQIFHSTQRVRATPKSRAPMAVRMTVNISSSSRKELEIQTSVRRLLNF